MLAHARPVRTGARHLDFRGLGEEAVLAVGDDLHHPVREAPLEQLDQRAHLPGALSLDTRPMPGRQRLDPDFDVIEARAAHHCRNDAGAHLEVEHGTISRIAAAARQPVLVVPVGLEILAPGLAPEAARDGATLDHHGRGLAAALGQRSREALAFPGGTPALLEGARLACMAPPAHLSIMCRTLCGCPAPRRSSAPRRSFR